MVTEQKPKNSPRYVSIALGILAVLALVVLAISTYVQPIIPAGVSSWLVLFFAALLSVAAVLASLKSATEFILMILNPKEKSGRKNAKVESLKVLHNLPHPSYANFIGRKSELDKIHSLLDPHSRHFVIVIDGIGGVGKSALAQEVANYYVSSLEKIPADKRFDAIIWMSAKRTELTASGILSRPQALHTIEDIYNSIALTLGRKNVIQAPIEEQHELIKGLLTQQRILLIVDNLETIDDDRVVNFIRDVPEPTKVIVTTRHRIDIAYGFRMKGMEEVDAFKLIQNECSQKQVTLNEKETRKLCDGTAGVPLAIVWSIAQIAMGYPAEKIIVRLAQPTSDIARFCFEGVIETIREKPSYSLLLALALFLTGANRTALGYVADLYELDQDNGLVELENLSLINKTDGRFQMLPLTLSYAKAELRKNPALEASLRERWLRYYLLFLNSQGQKYESMDNVSLEISNLLDVMDWCLHSNRMPEFIDIIDHLNFYLWATGNWNSWNTYLQKGPEIAKSLDNNLAQASFVGWLSSMRYYQDSLDEAEEYIRQAINLYQQLGEKGELALSLRRLASIQIKRGETADARQNLDKALALAQEVCNGRYISRIQRQLAKLDINDGNYIAAEARLQQALEFREQDTKVSSGLAYTYRLLGQIARLRGDYEASKKYLQRSLEIGREIHSQHDVAESGQSLAELELDYGHYENAKRWISDSIEVFRKLDMSRELQEAEELLKKAEARKGKRN